MSHKTRNTQWHVHVNAVNPSPQIRDWLTDRDSLTRKLIDHCQHFRVQRLRQQRARSLMDECAAIELPRRVNVHEREVLLRCDDVPVVFAHTIVPLTATASDWPFFSSLGERSLGTTLFGDPQVSRGALQFTRLHSEHPLAQRACAAMGVQALDTPLFARRCLFKRKNGLLLVTEIFLPTLFNKQNNR
ncbi:MAG TPA: chorismate lyase [Burkholderiaceae bacterium]|jgi:chorismate--pyruvate lyase